MRGWDSCRETIQKGWQAFRANCLVPPENEPVLVRVKDSGPELEGVSGNSIRLLIPEAWCFSVLAELPRGLAGEELREAGYWEMVGHLSDEGMEPEHFAIGVARMEAMEAMETMDAGEGAGSQTCWLSAVPREKLETLRQKVSEAGLRLDSIGLDGAHDVTFWRAEAEPWLARRLLVAGGIVLALVMGFLAGMDLFTWEQAHAELEAQQQVLAGLDADRRAMSMRQSVHARTREKTAILSQLSRERPPGYSVLVHLGTMAVEGAWFDGIRIEKDDVLSIEGTAVDYAAVTRLLAAFEQDQDFFPDGPIMEEARQAEDGTIHYKMRIGGDAP